MTPKAKEYRNGWSTYMEKNGWLYLVLVRDAQGNIYDKMRGDNYNNVMKYWKAFNAIAKTGAK